MRNKKALQSMQMFLYICEYLGITPKDFFSDEIESPSALKETMSAFGALSSKQLELLIALAKEMK
jgi:hypothetical protein